MVASASAWFVASAAIVGVLSWVSSAPAGAEQERALAEARRLYDERAYELARDESSRLLREIEDREGADSPAAGRALEILLLARIETGPIDGLLPLAERLVTMRASQADAVALKAKVLLATGRLKESLEEMRRALELREAALGANDPALVETLRELGGLMAAVGQPAEARQALERALAIAERAFGPTAPEVADVLDALALASVAPAPEDAKRHVERSMSIRQAGPPEAPGRGRTLDLQGYFRYLDGDYLEARRLHEQALEANQRVFGPRHNSVATSLINLANTLQRQGALAEARPLYERALAIRERVFGAENVPVSALWNNLGVLLWETGDYERAREGFERTIAIRRRVLGPQHYEVSEALNNLGLVLRDQGDLEGARRAHEEALAIRRALPDRRVAMAKSLANLGSVLGAMGKLEPALEHLASALEIQIGHYGPRHRDVALTLWDTGRVLVDAGDPAAAADRLERACDTLRQAVGQADPTLPDAEAALARAYYLAGRDREALTMALSAEETIRAQFRETTRALSEREALRYVAARASGLDVALTLLAQPAVSADVARSRVFDMVVRSRALVLDEMTERRRLAAGEGSALVERKLQELARARRTLASVAVDGYADPPPPNHAPRLAEAQDAVEVAERRVAESSRAYRDRLERLGVGLKDVANALPEGAALVAFVRYDRLVRRAPPRAGPPVTEDSIPSYVAFVAERGGAPALVPLGKASTIDGLVQRWLVSVSHVPGFAPAARESEARYREIGRELRRAVWDPVTKELGAARLVFVVPDGLMHHVAFATLPVDSERYLVEDDVAIHYLSAERDLVTRPESRKRGRGLLAVGGPSFDGPVEDRSRGSHLRSGCAELQGRRFAPLVWAKVEAEEIAELWRESTVEAEREALLLTGARANETAVKQGAPGRRVIHLATHSFFAPAECGSVLDGPAAPASRRVASEDPMLHAGLVLAGANRRGTAGPEQEDGMLTAQEIAALELSGVEWVVLSACETAAGEVLAGEGVLGLRRAFQLGGAATLVMSLWDVDDEATREWMRQLYANRLRGLSTVEAGARTSRSVLEARRRQGMPTHPGSWGAFVAIGDWR